jgi:O-antigen ligase
MEQTYHGMAGSQPEYKCKLLNFMASAGFVISTATQLRWSSIGIGPGEIILFFWCAIAFVFGLTTESSGDSWIKSAITRFWLVSLMLMGFGTVCGLLYPLELKFMAHDVLAFSFVAVILFILLSLPDFEFNILQIADMVFVLGTVLLFALYAYSLLHTSIGGLQLWVGRARFLGWARNSNQIALLLLPFPFYGVYKAYSKRKSPIKLLGYMALAGMSITMGVATGSDALIAVWVITPVLLFILLFIRLLCGRRAQIVKILALIGLIAVILLLPFWTEIFFRNLFYKDGQGDIRLILWENGFKAILMSPVFGWGPGSHSGIYAPMNWTEAHNTVIDWGGSTGFAGIAVYLMLLISFARRLVRNKSRVLMISFLSLFMYSLTHYIMRQPIYWLYLVVHVVLSDRLSGGFLLKMV